MKPECHVISVEIEAQLLLEINKKSGITFVCPIFFE